MGLGAMATITTCRRRSTSGILMPSINSGFHQMNPNCAKPANASAATNLLLASASGRRSI